MELIDCKKQIKDLVFAMANAIGPEQTEEYLTLLIAILNKHKAEEQ
jgi:hypothetical protein